MLNGQVKPNGGVEGTIVQQNGQQAEVNRCTSVSTSGLRGQPPDSRGRPGKLDRHESKGADSRHDDDGGDVGNPAKAQDDSLQDFSRTLKAIYISSSRSGIDTLTIDTPAGNSWLKLPQTPQQNSYQKILQTAALHPMLLRAHGRGLPGGVRH